jgi:hypothetical protein
LPSSWRAKKSLVHKRHDAGRRSAAKLLTKDEARPDCDGKLDWEKILLGTALDSSQAGGKVLELSKRPARVASVGLARMVAEVHKILKY